MQNDVIEKLLRHIGYGAGEIDPNMVEVLIIGNESGTGGQTLEEFLTGSHTSKSESAQKTGDDVTKTSPFLQYIKRLSLYMEDGHLKWFNSKRNFGEDEGFKEIMENWCGKNTHLIDIRPLPRPNESDWPYEFYKGLEVDKNQYLEAFNHFNVNAAYPYGEWVAERRKHLNEQLSTYSNLKCIIAPGAHYMKKTFLENCFSFEQPFSSVCFVNARGKKKEFWVNRFNIGDRSVQVCICPFFNHYLIGLDGLKYMATEILKRG